jgi:hypothetical protein
MTKPVRLRLSRAKGFNLQAASRALNGLDAVKVTRPGKYGNPFNFSRSEYCWAALSFGCRGDRLGRQEASVRAFRDWIDPRWGRQTLSMEEQPKLAGAGGECNLGPKIAAGAAPARADIVRDLRGKNLACWCKPGDPCHADVLLELANASSVANPDSARVTAHEEPADAPLS